MMYFHIRIHRKEDLYHNPGEVVLNLSEEELQSRFLRPYENATAMMANGATILSSDIYRVQVKASPVALPIQAGEDESARYDLFKNVLNDVTAKYILGPAGYKSASSERSTMVVDASRSGRDVFVSHAESDGRIAMQIAEHLEAAGWTTWYYERDSVAGPRHLEQTGRQIDSCKAVVVVLSKASIASEYVANEVFRASEIGKRMIPVLVDTTHDELLNQSPKWPMAFGFAVTVQWTVDNPNHALARIAGGVAYFEGKHH